MRHFLLPIYQFEDSRCKESYIVGVLNRKRGIPDRLWMWTGALSLFGGAASDGEDPIDTIRRELLEDLPALSLEGLSTERMITIQDMFTITPMMCGKWSQDEYRRLAASCTEGVVDWVAYRPSMGQHNFDEWCNVPWVSTSMMEAIKKFLHTASMDIGLRGHQ